MTPCFRLISWKRKWHGATLGNTSKNLGEFENDAKTNFSFFLHFFLSQGHWGCLQTLPWLQGRLDQLGGREEVCPLLLSLCQVNWHLHNQFQPTFFVAKMSPRFSYLPFGETLCCFKTLLNLLIINLICLNFVLLQEKQLKAPVPPLHRRDWYKQHQNCVQGKVWSYLLSFFFAILTDGKNPPRT